MNNKEFKQELIQELLLNIQPSYYKNYELNVRCPFCGDSVKNANSAHLSIRINPDDDQPLVFRCLRCNTTGIFNGTTLSMIGIYSSTNSTNIERYNRLSCKKHGLTSSKKGLNIKFPELQINDSVLQKHRYIENRLGTSLDINELHEKKIVYDFVGLLKYNKIEKIYGNVEHIKALQNDHVGFLSARNDFINFRDMTGNHKRYYIYKIMRNLDTTGKFYIMPNNIDPFNSDMKYINLTEGVFDILGLYYNIMDKYEYNTVYASINGSGYLNVIKYILEQGLLCDVNVNIFSDADRSPSYYKSMVRTLMPFVNDVRLFYNDIGKDYGVPKEQVKLKEVDINYMK
jgi:hypothetical protein